MCSEAQREETLERSSGAMREETRGFELSWAASLRREVWMEVFFQVREFSFWELGC